MPVIAVDGLGSLRSFTDAAAHVAVQSLPRGIVMATGQVSLALSRCSASSLSASSTVVGAKTVRSLSDTCALAAGQRPGPAPILKRERNPEALVALVATVYQPAVS
jgi:hypothetical protein